MTYWRRFLWKWSWIFTIPIVVLFFYWGWVTLDRYLTFGVRYDSTPAKMTLLRAGHLEAAHLIRKMSLAIFTTNTHGTNKDQLKTINLFVPESHLAKLNSNLPHSGFEYVKGGLLKEQKISKIKMKYRGDYLPHWGFFKRSIRIKTKKNDLFEGMRSFNIIAPKGVFQLHNYLAYRLADYLDLMTPHAEMVQLNLNGKRQGLHLLVEQLEELTLRNHNRMPGDLYVGELVAKDAYKGVNHKVFEHPGLWKKIAVNNHYPLDSRKPLEKLIQLINAPPSDKVQQQLSQMLDMDAWGRFSAFETLTQSFHFDNAHNWRLYYDPMRSMFEPIVWDPLAWTPPHDKIPHLEAIRTKLHAALYRNADFLRSRHKTIRAFFESGADAKFLKEADQVIDSVKAVIAWDPNLIYPAKKIENSLSAVRYRIDKVFRHLKEQLLAPHGGVSYSTIPNGFNLLVTGRRPVERIRLLYEKPLKTEIAVTVSYFKSDKKVVKDVTGTLNHSGIQLELELPLISGMEINYGDVDVKNRLKMLPGYYEFNTAGVSADNKLQDIFIDRGGDKLELAIAKNRLPKHSFNNLYRIVHSTPLKIPTRWSGDIQINGVQEIFDELIIEPGTTIRMHPGASLILHNRLLSRGTNEHPIRFLPAVKDQKPWGAVVLTGKSANYSILSYCEFAGGSGLKNDLTEYTAMFSVHDVDHVEVNNCLFRDSKITDDMVHTVYAQIRFSNCRFERSLMDALDIDISDAIIENCHFIDSGNDAIDLMSSSAVVYDTLVENGGDKAASVGEGSNLLAINNVFRNNVIGVQAKDGSVASLYNIDLVGNDHALDAYKKNWRYNSGGTIFINKSTLIGNEKMITADKHSAINVYDSYMDKNNIKKKKRLRIDATVDDDNERVVRDQKLHRNKTEIEYMKDFDVAYWKLINSETRGAMKLASR